MKLTDKELEIMGVLWASDVPLTTTEIIERSPTRKTWKESSIFIMINNLVWKKAIVMSRLGLKNARAYQANITPEEYAVMAIRGLPIDREKFLAEFEKVEDTGWTP